MHPLYNLDVELCLPFCDPVIGQTRRCMQYYECCGMKPVDEQATKDEAVAFAKKDALAGELDKGQI